MSRPVGGGFPNIPDCDPDFAAGDLVAWWMRGDDRVMFNHWLGPTGRDRHGRFVRKGSEEERFLFDCGLVYRRLDVDRGGIRIFGIAILAREDEGALRYAGGAFFALKGPNRERLRHRLERLASDRSPIPSLKRRDARWLVPEVTVVVRHLKGAGAVRHATVKAIAE